MTKDILPYNPDLKRAALEEERLHTVCELLLWHQIEKRKLGVFFHPKVPVMEYLVDFYCDEKKIALFINTSEELSEEASIIKKKRDFELKKSGVTVIYIEERDIRKNLLSVVQFLIYKIRQL